MKKLALYLAFITLSLNIQAQNNQQKIKELETTIQNLNARLESLTRDNEEYKKALNIKNAPNYQMYENIKLSVESVEGNENTGELIVTIKCYNNGPDKEISTNNGGTIIDYSGKNYKSAYFGVSVNDGKSYGIFYKDTPGSIKYRFKDVQNCPSRLNSIVFELLGDLNNLNKQTIKFRDVPVTWK